MSAESASGKAFDLGIFLRKGFAADEQTRELAVERATEASLIILHAQLDSPFNHRRLTGKPKPRQRSL